MSNDQALPSHESYLELSAPALEHNMGVFRKLISPHAQLGIVLKGNAYGHGLREVLSVVHSHVDCIYLIAARDAFLVREYERRNQLAERRIVVIGVCSAHEMLECALNRIEVALGVTDWRRFAPVFESLSPHGQVLTLKAHLHLDTGLSREGIRESDLAQELEDLGAAGPWLSVVGVMSHFANTEDVTEQEYAHQQLETFERMAQRVERALGMGQRLERHFGASAATLVLPQSRYDIVRIGISLYGMWPSTEARISAKLVLKEVPEFKPVLSWRCSSQMIKSVPKGTFVGYGCTYRCDHDTVIAVFPVGYFDGYPRLASGKAHVLVRGRRCPVIGRVMMNHMIVDVTSVVQEGESQVVATLLGAEGEEKISAELLASWAQTIHYEMVTRLGSHLKRVVVR